MRRHVFRLSIALLSLLVVLSTAPTRARADSPSISAPTALAMSVPGTSRSVLAGGWINTTKLNVHFGVQVAGVALTPQVEFVASNVPFTGNPTASGTAMSASGQATVAISGLQSSHTYHWQARLVDASNNASPWVAFAPGGGTAPDVGVDQVSPTRPIFSSSTNPDQSKWYKVPSPVVHWQSYDALSGVAGYTVQLLRQPHVIKAGKTTSGTGARLSNLADGSWWVAVRSEDRAGNWSPTGTFQLNLDRKSPYVWWIGPKRLDFNPYHGVLTAHFKVSKTSNLKLDLWRVGAKAPIARYSYTNLSAGQTVAVTWNGKVGSGRYAPKGFYYFAADVSDHANNLMHRNLGGIDLTPNPGIKTPAGVVLYPDSGKTIIVSLSQETLYAYDGTKQVLRTYVTTGNPNLPTPPGSYTVMARYHPYEFISPWPEGSPYYYPPSWSQYALLFRDGGYFLHDAPWRSAFGPGTNGPGQPGTNYGGTHGCVNIPPDPMVFLWNWAPIGTTVLVVN